MADIIQIRRDTAANWVSANPTLADGEFGYETDTRQFKVGDGLTAWNSLPYGGISGPTGGFSYQTMAATGTAAPTEVRHTVYVPTSGITVTLPSASEDDRITVFNLSGDDVTVAGTGLSGDDTIVGTLLAIEYTWHSAQWEVFAAGGSGFTPSYETMSASGTATLEEIVHTVYATTEDITVTLPTPEDTDQRVLVYNLSGGGIEISGTGLSSETIRAGYSIEYSWYDSQWNSIVDNNPLGNLQVPQPQKFIEKWNDGGAGNVTSKVNEWGTGKYKLTLRRTDTTPDQDITADVYIVDETLNGITPNLAGGSYYFSVNYVASSGSFTVTSDIPGSTYSIAYIYRWEDDPDNLPILEIPADPGIIKDWVSKWDDEDARNIASVVNSWGAGKYWIEYYDNTSTPTYASGVIIISEGDGDSAGQSISGSSTIRPYWDQSDNSFKESTGRYIKEIFKWEDVAATDAQLNPPVDGWETVFDDDTNIADVTNLWGVGEYKIICRRSTDTKLYSFHLSLTNLEVINESTAYGSSQTARVTYDNTTNAFTITDTGLTGTFYIQRIDKFNSLVNVYHSYHPDPRQVAQKDWVTVWEDQSNIATAVTYKVPAGRYEVSLQTTGTVAYSVMMTVTQENVDVGHTISVSLGSGSVLTYNASTGVWTSPSTAIDMKRIRRYQDSQASDSPREVLSDGWELVYEDESNTADVPIADIDGWGLGDYRIEVKYTADNSRRNSRLWVSDLSVDNYGTEAVGATSTSNGRIWFDTSTSLVRSETSTIDIKKIWKFKGLLSISAQYNVTSLSDGKNQVQAINTDAADVAVTLPSSPTLGQLFEVWNTGTNGHHVEITTDGSTLYNSLRIGDKKGLKLRYVDGWKYEDVIIDEYSSITTDYIFAVTKYAGGKMRITGVELTTSGNRTITLPETFTDANYSTTASNAGTSNPISVNACSHTSSSFETRKWNASGVTTVGLCRWIAEGRWKTGV